MNSEITAFYNNTNVLITGGTGLLGQLIIEKLLRVCDVDKIYLILRQKKGKSGLERMLEAFKGPVFDKVRKINPQFLNKIQVFEGDCSQASLGLDTSNCKMIIEKINVIFHCAAILNMESNLGEAVNTNIRGLHEILSLCHKIVNLKSVVFVSTAYSNSIHTVIEEKFYDSPLKPDTIMKFAEEVNHTVLKSIQNVLVDKWPNTYCYSKAIAENLIRDNVGILPVALFRPSVIMSTHSEPVPGWISNIYGPIGFFLATGLGVLRVSFCNPDGKLDFVPADFCVNALICTAWETHCKFKSSSPQVPVYNYSRGRDRSITIQTMVDYAKNYEYPFKNAIWITQMTITDRKIYYIILQLLLHYIPGYLTDLCLLLRGKKAQLIEAYGKLSKMNNVLSFFTCQEWNIVNDNVRNMWCSLNETDKQLFPFDMNAIDDMSFLCDCATGIKLYILKETLDNVEEEKKKYQRMLKIHNTMVLLFRVLMVFIFFRVCFVAFSF